MILFLYKISNYTDNADENIAVLKRDKDTNNDTVERKHLHDCIEIVYILSGSGEHVVDGVSHTVGEGSIVFINYNQTHSFTAPTLGLIIIYLYAPKL